MSLRDTLQDLVNKDHDELFILAKMAMAEIMPHCKAADALTGGFAFLAGILTAAVATDGALSQAESRFVSELTGLNEQQILALIPQDRERAVAAVDRFVDSLDVGDKASACLLIATVLACDERIDVEENVFIRKILA